MTTAVSSQQDVGAHVARRLAEQVGARKYAMWFDRSARFDVRDDGGLTVTVPNRFIADWIGKNFTEDLRIAAGDALGENTAVELRVEPDRFPAAAARTAAAAPVPATPAAPAAATTPRPAMPDRSSAGLRHELGSFVVGPSNQLAYAAACRLADETAEAGHPVFLHGGCGLGKTHLLQGACNALLQRRPDARVLYTTGEQFTNDYITAVRANKLDAFRRRIRALELLAVDDVHFIANKQATQQEFLHSFDQIELGGSRVILASDCHPKLIKQFSEGLISRCVRGLVVQVDRPDRETRLRLVHAMGERRGMRFGTGVAEALADRSEGSVREIEGMLTKLLALASLAPGSADARGFAGRETLIGHALVRQLLATDPVSTRVRRPVRYEEIARGVAACFGITVQQLSGRSRHKQIVLARSLAIHLARQLTSMSYPEIATAMGKGNHSTIITAAQRVERMLQADEPILLPHFEGEPANLRPTELVDRLRTALTAG